MTQESRLAVTIDSRSAKRSADDMSDSLQRMERSGDNAAASADRVTGSLGNQQKELSQLLGQINPTVAALGRLDEMQEKLASFKKAGVVESDTFVEYTKRIETMRAAVGGASDSIGKLGVSSAQTANAMRQLPAQITDVVTQLAGGQSLFTVLIQQGGQIKDSFGGVGEAIGGVAGYFSDLASSVFSIFKDTEKAADSTGDLAEGASSAAESMNNLADAGERVGAAINIAGGTGGSLFAVGAFAAVAAAATALAVAYYQGSKEADAFEDALILTGNAAGTSAGALGNLAQQVADMGTTVGAAAGVLAQLAASGNRLVPMYAKIAEASIAWSERSGADIKKVVKSFNEIASSPVEAVKKLDAELNFLTASQYANIVSLQEQRKTMEAAEMAADLYATTISGRAKEIKENLGYLEGAWDEVADAAKGAWDRMLDVGREKTLEQQLAEVEKGIEEASKGIMRGGRAAFGLGLGQDSKQDLEDQRTRLKLAIQARDIESATASLRGQNSADAKKGLDGLNAAYKSSLTQTEKLQKQISDLDRDRKNALKEGPISAETEARYVSTRKKLEQDIADIKEREAKKNAPKNADRGVAEAQNTFAKLYGQYDPAAQAARALTKEQEQLDLVLRKGKISQEEYGKALAQASANYAAAIKGAQGLTVAEQYRAQVQRKIAIESEGYRIEAASVGMGDVQADRYRQRVTLERQMNDEILALQDNLRLAENAGQRAAIQEQIKILEETNPARRKALEDGFVLIDQEKANPFNGWTASLQNFQTQAADVAGQTQTLFTNAFGTISGGVGNAFEKMALEGQTFGESVSQVTRSLIGGVINSLGQMAAQWAINQAIQIAFGKTRQVMAAEEMARIAAQTTAESAGAATVAAAKVAADGISTASSLTATATTTTAQVAAAGTTMAAWLPAALVASVGTFGAAAIVGGTALLAAFALIKGFSTGGYVSGSGTGTSDSIPARLSNGEFVVNAKATARNRELLEAINSNERVSFAGEGMSISSVKAGSAGASGSIQQNVNIHNYTDSRVQTRQGANGELDVIITAVKDSLADDIATGSGSFVDAGESAYGWRRQPY